MFKNYLILKYLIIGSTPNQAQEPLNKNNIFNLPALKIKYLS